ncbi:hypothetical protein SAMN05216419_10587 [Nitrosomonas cryotolerans]|uniref:Acetyltransferase (GNAT) domain-containing protein n=2 Tax=Nitrosomonas cryotolerans TaxID=44575 RepID=A0A1N6HQ04_9PROT|nr:hypothetical protein SAMN05216419_10587 [Nitrosomonas cryotolerans]SIO21745.1 hypothetical protein SAMN02743940_1291 [Nitrosomonas cryotolerans ATCC 49181]
MGMPPFIIRLVNWRDEAHLLRPVREAVFIKEQQIPAELEWDAFDISSLHALALAADGRPIGTARLLSDGHIGRMAVLQEWRGQCFDETTARGNAKQKIPACCD